MSDDVALLVPFSEYEENAVNIGTQQKSADMARFIQTVRDDGLYLLDVASTDQRIRLVAQFLCRYEPGRVMVVSARQYGQRPARLFAEAIGANASVVASSPGPDQPGPSLLRGARHALCDRPRCRPAGVD